MKYILFLLSLLFFLCFPLYSESVYTITENQLEELKEINKNYNELQANYETLQKSLKKQTQDYQKSLQTLKRQDMILTASVGCCSFCLGGLITFIILKEIQ